MRIAVVDHGAGNLVSIAQGLSAAGCRVVVSADRADLSRADGVVLPGVGSTGSVMEGLRAGGFIGPLLDLEGPLLGICVGMQVLFTTSEEDGADCLGVWEGTVRKLSGTPRIPHIGWNDVYGQAHPLFAGTDRVFYFVHSFAPVPADPEVVIGETTYGESFCSAVSDGSRHGVQFHPERSGPAGLQLLANFVSLCEEAADAA
jgi:glutamine amidotransferase